MHYVIFSSQLDRRTSSAEMSLHRNHSVVSPSACSSNGDHQENHYQNYSIKYPESQSGSSFDNYDEDGVEDRPVYANQNTLQKTRQKKLDQVPIPSLDGTISTFEDDHLSPKNADSKKGGRWCELLTCVFTTCGITVLIGSYIFLGAFLFTALEGPNESLEVHKLEKFRNETIVKLATDLHLVNVYSDHWENTIQKYFKVYEQRLISACRDDGLKLQFSSGITKGGSGKKLQTVKKWTFKGSLYFVISTLTTIGSGLEAMIPQTTWGIVIFFIYTVIGIPLMIIWLVTVGASFAYIIIIAYNIAVTYFSIRCCNSKTDVYRPTKSKSPEEKEKLMGPLMLTLLLFISWASVGIYVLSVWEKLTYLQSSLHIFGIFSTIGTSRKDLSFVVHQPTDNSSSQNDQRFATFLSFVVFGFILLTSCIRIFYLVIARCSSCSKSCCSKS